VKSKIILVLAVIVTAASFLIAQELVQKVPDDIGVKIRTIQVDQTRRQDELQVITNRYKEDQDALAKDASDIEDLKKQALAKLNADSSKWEVNETTLTLVAKPAPPPPAVPPAPSPSPDVKK
jgi:hypothetical protein